MADATSIASKSCGSCGTELPPRFLVCPSCGTLVHRDELKRLAQEATEAEKLNDRSISLAAWRSALELLPPGTKQGEQIQKRIRELSKALDANEPGKPKEGVAGKAGVIGTALLFLVTKGKFLLLGLTKVSTLFSMLLSLGVYWQLHGWRFAVGLVASIYVHEMGHVWALRRYGIKATAPMFIPGFGAVVRLNQHPATRGEDARTGLAGPLWGTAAAIVTWVVARQMQWEAWAATAHVAAWINLFNLLPVWQLDGSRGFAALTTNQRWTVVAALALAMLVGGDVILLLILAVAVVRALRKADAAPEPDNGVLAQYIGLVFVLAALARFDAITSFN